MTWDTTTLLTAMGAGVGGGALSGLFGVGGGLILVPLLSVGLQMPQVVAQGATLAANLLPTGLPAVLHYRRDGVATSLPLVGVLILGFLLGVAGGAAVANSIPAPVLRWGFVTCLLYLAVKTWRRQEPPRIDRGGAPLDLRGQLWRLGLPLGVGAGVVSGLTGLGGSVVVIPFLASRFKMTQHEAQLTTLLLLLPPVGLPGVWVYMHAQGGLPWVAIAGIIPGFALGSWLGAQVATRLRGPQLKQVFAVLLLGMALLVAIRGR